jgi:hypothetical protein
MTIPEPVRQALIDAGKLTEDGLGRAAQLRTCPRCRQWVVVGVDHHRCALTVTCDPVDLDPIGEAVAVLAGRNTYELWGKEIERRDAFKISGGQHQPVIAAHQCGTTAYPTPSIIRLFVPATVTAPLEDTCPF